MGSETGIKGFGKRGVRAAIVGLAGGAAMGLMAFFGGGDATAGTTCSAADNNRVEHSSGASRCVANAGPGSRAHAQDTSSSGTAIAVATTRGEATSRNLQPGSQAMSSGVNGGRGYAFTTGPKGESVAMGRNGGTSVSVAGWGGQAYAGPDGAYCSGGFGAAYDSTTGRYCVRSGSIDLH